MAEGIWVPGIFENDEEKCLEKIKQFCGLFPSKFTETAATEYGTVCDVVGNNSTGGTTLIEGKYRADGSRKYPDLFIEVDKYNNLMELYRTKGTVPFYLNMIVDDPNFYLWILPTVDIGKCKLYKNYRIPDKTCETGYKYVDRYGLKWQDAWIFDSDGKIVQKSECEKKSPRPKKTDIDLNKPITNKTLKHLK